MNAFERTFYRKNWNFCIRKRSKSCSTPSLKIQISEDLSNNANPIKFIRDLLKYSIYDLTTEYAIQHSSNWRSSAFFKSVLWNRVRRLNLIWSNLESYTACVSFSKWIFFCSSFKCINGCLHIHKIRCWTMHYA